MNYVGQKIVDSVLTSLSRNETMERIGKMSEPSVKLAIGQFIKSIEDPVNDDLINSHLIQPVSMYVSDRMKPHALTIVCLFAFIALILVVQLVLTVRSHRAVRKRMEIEDDIESA